MAQDSFQKGLLRLSVHIICVFLIPPPHPPRPHGDDIPDYQCTPFVIHTSITTGVILALVR